MIVGFIKLMELSDYMLLIAAGLLTGIYIYHFIRPRINEYYSFTLKPKRESDAYISTLPYHLKDNNGSKGNHDTRTKNIRII